MSIVDGVETTVPAKLLVVEYESANEIYWWCALPEAFRLLNIALFLAEWLPHEWG